MKITFFDVWDVDKINPVRIEGKKDLKVGDKFHIDDVSYRVLEREGTTAVVRMFKYRIPDTATQFVHKCPAKKDKMDGLDRDDIVSFEDKYGKKVADKMRSGRVKMGTLKLKTKCPFCKCIFWKENVAVPETVEVNKVAGRKQLKKRKLS